MFSDHFASQADRSGMHRLRRIWRSVFWLPGKHRGQLEALSDAFSQSRRMNLGGVFLDHESCLRQLEYFSPGPGGRRPIPDISGFRPPPPHHHPHPHPHFIIVIIIHPELSFTSLALKYDKLPELPYVFPNSNSKIYRVSLVLNLNPWQIFLLLLYLDQTCWIADVR